VEDRREASERFPTVLFDSKQAEQLVIGGCSKKLSYAFRLPTPAFEFCPEELNLFVPVPGPSEKSLPHLVPLFESDHHVTPGRIERNQKENLEEGQRLAFGANGQINIQLLSWPQQPTSIMCETFFLSVFGENGIAGNLFQAHGDLVAPDKVIDF
jgi:hypothetical protein